MFAVADEGKGVHSLSCHEEIYFHEVRLPVARKMVVQRRVPAGDGFQAVIKIQHNLVERQLIGQENALGGNVLEPLLHAALFLHQRQYPAQVFVIGEDSRRDHRFFDLGDISERGKLCRAFYVQDRVVLRSDAIAHTRSCGNKVQIELPLQTLLDDLHVQQAQEAAAESKAQRGGAFRLIKEGRIVEPQLFQRVAQ